MNRTLRFFCLLTLVLTSSLTHAQTQPPSQPQSQPPSQSAPAPALRLARRIALPGVTGRIDHLACDPSGQRLYVAALGNGSIEVLDLAGGQRIQSIPGLEEPQGLYFDPATHRLFAATGGDGALRVYDTAANNKLLSTIPLGEDADNVRGDPATGQVFAGYGGGESGAIAVIDAATLKKLHSFPLAGHPESFQLERRGSRIFVNVPTAHQIVALDRQQTQPAAIWPLKRPAQNFPMALDEDGKRLFIGCRKPARLVVLDAATGKPADELEISADTDDLFFDASRRRLYVICGAGVIDVFAQPSGAGKLRRVESLPTAPGARTGLFVPGLNRLFVAAPQREGKEAAILVFDVSP